MSWSIELEAVSKHYGGVKAVDDVTLSVPSGCLAGLMGPNGAGKSTLFNLVTRVTDLTAGSVRIGEHAVTKMTITQLAQLPIGRTFQTPRCFTSLTVEENVALMLPDHRDSLVGALVRRSRGGARDQQRELLATVGLEHRRKERAASLSGGERRMLEIARQLAREPKVLLLDEPTAGLDAKFQDRLQGLLLELHQGGMTILLVEHNVRFLLGTATRIYVMTQGKLIAEGDPATVAADEQVIAAYLGRRRSGDAAHR